MTRAIILTNGLLATEDAKTAHGLIRESNRYRIMGVVDVVNAGKDAGVLLDGRFRNIPVFATIAEAVSAVQPDCCVVGVATTGGIFPGSLLEDVKEAITLGLSVVNGLHDLLTEREEITTLAKTYSVTLTDVRKPPKMRDLHFWTGEILAFRKPVVAVLGTDCALGKRTTTRFLMHACRVAGINAEMIYTGQTGWLQGGKYGFVLDATPNDFVSGELEHAILSCEKETRADIFFIEGQAALRNPSGPCGSEMLISGGAKSVILIHSPKRVYYEHQPSLGKIPSLLSEIELVEKYGSTVIGVALNTEYCSLQEAENYQQQYEEELGLPVALPLEQGVEKLVPNLFALVAKSKAAI
ncbi:MAG: DUF1611 domain-containing protein [Chitinophagaceae bacterium]|nr:DUF1611 domain-containing protein [Chitinophagaceae bacterium]MCW5928327.1 DUF1611 domain-containing protein [Chitinophagaceae bacterium]